mmetsp:Transcript_70211/g.114016  ORF Transcript_70211/g.114016 Transcript_70211/m.114016 type:complete len:303 (-) Transcript_70211:236-1144(-)
MTAQCDDKLLSDMRQICDSKQVCCLSSCPPNCDEVGCLAALKGMMTGDCTRQQGVSLVFPILGGFMAIMILFCWLSYCIHHVRKTRLQLDSAYMPSEDTTQWYNRAPHYNSFQVPVSPVEPEPASIYMDSHMSEGVNLGAWTQYSRRTVMARTDEVLPMNACDLTGIESHAIVPDIYVCPITCVGVRDPVITCDGFTYERGAIEEWFAASIINPVSPVTGARLSNKILLPNYALRQVIEELRSPKCATSPISHVQNCPEIEEEEKSESPREGVGAWEGVSDNQMQLVLITASMEILTVTHDT